MKASANLYHLPSITARRLNQSNQNHRLDSLCSFCLKDLPIHAENELL